MDAGEKKCFCIDAISECVFEKCFENELFSIYGHLTKGSNILIKYHASTENTNLENLNMLLKFNNDENYIQNVNFVKCENSNLNDFCYLLNLKNNDSISFSYVGDNYHCFKIAEDPYKAIIERYHLDDKDTMPVVINNTNSFLNKLQTLFSSLLSLFKHLK